MQQFPEQFVHQRRMPNLVGGYLLGVDEDEDCGLVLPQLIDQAMYG